VEGDQERWIAIIVAVAGFLAIIQGVRVRRGTYRYWLRWYDDPDFWEPYRNAPLVAIPTGLWALLGGIGIATKDSAPAPVVDLLLAVALLALSFSGVASLRPPRWLIPRWLRERDVPHLPSRTSKVGRWFDVGLLGLCALGAFGGAVFLLARAVGVG
jgi:hypothetical protein